MVSYQILEKKLEKMKKNHSEKPFNGRIYLYWNLIVISVLKFNSFQFEMEIKWQTVTDVLAPPQAARALAGHRMTSETDSRWEIRERKRRRRRR